MFRTCIACVHWNLHVWVCDDLWISVICLRRWHAMHATDNAFECIRHMSAVFMLFVLFGLRSFSLSPFCSVLLSSALFLVIFCSPKGRWGRCHDERSPVFRRFRRFRRFRLDSSRLEDLSHIVAQRMSSVPELFIPPSTHSPWREHYCADRPHIFRVYSDILLTHCTSSISSLQAVTNP